MIDGWLLYVDIDKKLIRVAYLLVVFLKFDLYNFNMFLEI